MDVRMPDGTLVQNVPDNITQTELLSRYKKYQSTPETPKERTWGEAAKDIGAGVTSGIGSLVQLPGQLYGLATGNFEDTGLLGVGKKISQTGEEMKSEALKQKEAQRLQKIQEAEKQGQWEAFKTAAGETFKDSALLTSFLAEQAPQMVVPFGAAKAGKAITMGRGLGAGLAAEEAAQAAGTAGTRAAIGAGAIQQGADIGTGAYENIYKTLVDKGTPPEEAKSEALNLARAAGLSGAVISLLAQKLPGAKTLEESFAGVPGTTGRLLGAGKGALGESLSEVAEETGGRLSQNIAARQVNPEQELTQGLGATAGMAAIGGAGFGGVAGAIRTPQEAPKPAEATQARPQPSEAPIIDPDKYKGVIEQLYSVIPDSGLSDTTKIAEIFKSSGIQDEAEIKAYLREAEDKQDLKSHAIPIFEVKDAEGNTLFRTTEQAVADKAMERLNAEEPNKVSVVPVETAKLLKPSGYSAGFEISQGLFTQQKFDIVSGDAKLSPKPMSLEEVDQKVQRLTDIRKENIKGIDKEIENLQKKVDKNNLSVETMEAEGQTNTPEYTALTEQVSKNNLEIKKNIDELTNKKNSLAEPLMVQHAKASDEGFTVFQNGRPLYHFPTLEKAEETIAAAPTSVATPQAVEAKEALRQNLLPFMQKVGLEGTALRIIDSIESTQGSADGYYAQNVIQIALEAKNPMATLRHETIHALKELGAFTDQEWKILEAAAKKEWITRFIKNRKTQKGKSLYDAYKDIYLQDNGSLNGFDEYITEEAIADAFKYFNANGAPVSAIGVIFRKIKALLEALRNGFSGNGFKTADQVFKRVEMGKMRPTRAAPEGNAPRYQVFSLDNKRKDIFTDPDTLDAWKAIGRNDLAQPVAERFSTRSRDEAEREIYKKYLTKKDILEAARIQGDVKPNYTTDEGSAGNQYIQNILYDRSNNLYLEEIKQLKKSGPTEMGRAQEVFGEVLEDNRTNAQKARDAMAYNRERVEFLKKTPEELQDLAAQHAYGVAYSDQADGYQEAQSEGVTLSDAELEKIGDAAYKNAYEKELTRLQKRQEKLRSEREAPRFSLKGTDEIKARIDVDGVMRPTRNNKGILLHPTKEGIKNFWRWFGNSVVVDDKGFPRLVLHGTSRDFEKFIPKQAGAIFFTDDPFFANTFSNLSQNWMVDHVEQFLTPKQIEEAKAETLRVMDDLTRREYELTQDSPIRDFEKIYEWELAVKPRLPTSPNIMPIYVKMENPFDYENKEHVELVADKILGGKKRIKFKKDIEDVPPGKSFNRDDLIRLMYGDKNSSKPKLRQGGFWQLIENDQVINAIKSLGFDGISVFEDNNKNYAVFKENQIKSAVGNVGTFNEKNPNIRYSLKSPDIDSANFKKWSKNAPIIPSDDTSEYKGGPAVFQAYHGTTHTGISTFKVDVGNKEGFLGQGPYFSTSIDDVNANYAGVGPDLTARIGREEENISEAFNDDPWNATGILEDYFQSEGIDIEVTDENIDELKDEYGEKAVSHAAIKAVKGDSEGVVIPSYVRLLNPFDMRSKGGTEFNIDLKEDEDGNVIEESGTAIDLIKNINEVAGWYGVDASSLTNFIYERALDGVSAKEVFDKASKEISDIYDDSGEIVSSGHFIREVAQEMGFDGLIQEAGDYFGPNRKNFAGLRIPGMKGVFADTLHLMPFKSDQVKSFIGNIGTWGQEKPTAEQAKRLGMTLEQAEREQNKGDIRYSIQSPDTPEFKRWFGDSKVVDKDGKPLVVYHGSGTKNLSIFDTKLVTKRTPKGDLAGTYFTADINSAGNYAKRNGEVYAVYLSIKNPLNTTKAIKKYINQGMTFGEAKRKALEALTPENDGVIFDGNNYNPSEYVVFNSNQIKSASRNIGTFDEKNPDIRYSLKSAVDLFDPNVIEQKKETEFGSRSKLIDMNIDDFLALATPGKDEGKERDVEKVLDSGKKLSSLPRLGAYQEKGAGDLIVAGNNDPRIDEINDHEGRHRARALKKRGYDTMPVILTSNIRWSFQNNPSKKFDYIKDWPKKIVGYDGYSIDFPVSREDAGKDYQPQAPAKYSLRDDFDTNFGQAGYAALNRATYVRKDKGFAQRMAEAISPDRMTAIRQRMVNKYESVERLSKKVAAETRPGFMGAKELLADVSANAAVLQSERAAGVAAEVLMNGIPVYDKGYTKVSDMNGKVKGLIPILEPLLSKYKDPLILQMFQFYSATRRGIRLYKEGREQLLTPADFAMGKKLEALYPEFKIAFEEYQKFNEGLVKFLVDTGVLSQKMAAEWTKYGDYIPFYRQIDGEETVGPKMFQNLSGVKPTAKLKGGEEKIGDYLETVVRNTRSAIEQGMKNVAAQRIVRDVMRLNTQGMNDMGRRLQPHEKGGDDVVTVRENGQDVRYKVADPLLVESMKSLHNMGINSFWKFLSYPTKLLRELVTKDPSFILANLARDSMQAWVTSGVSMIPIVDTFKQFGKVLANQSPEAKALRAAGIGTGYEFSGDIKASSKAVMEALNDRAGIKTNWQKAMWPVSKVWDALDKGSSASDLATRAEIYKKVLAETGNEAEAIYQSLEVMNFGRMGSSPMIQVISAIVPFFNARVQGMDVLYRAGFGKMASQSAKAQHKAFMIRALTIVGLSLMYYMMARDTDEWKRASKEMRDNYWIVGNVRIPIPFEIGVLFKVAPERIAAYFDGRDTGSEVFESAARNIISTLKLVPIPQAALPLVEEAANYSFFTGEPIVSRGVENVAAPYQERANTSLMAKKLGEQLGLSPIRIDHVLQGYTGSIGTYAAQMIDAFIRTEEDGVRPAMSLEQTPVIKRFFASDKSGGTIDAFYSLKKEVDEVVRTQHELQMRGNPDQYMEYMEKNGQLLALKGLVSNIDKQMTNLRKMRNMINFSQGLDADGKREALDNIRYAEIALTENIKEIRKNVMQ
jgi:hypothetical protein